MGQGRSRDHEGNAALSGQRLPSGCTGRTLSPCLPMVSVLSRDLRDLLRSILSLHCPLATASVDEGAPDHNSCISHPGEAGTPG